MQIMQILTDLPKYNNSLQQKANVDIFAKDGLTAGSSLMTVDTDSLFTRVKITTLQTQKHGPQTQAKNQKHR